MHLPPAKFTKLAFLTRNLQASTHVLLFPCLTAQAIRIGKRSALSRKILCVLYRALQRFRPVNLSGSFDRIYLKCEQQMISLFQWILWCGQPPTISSRQFYCNYFSSTFITRNCASPIGRPLFLTGIQKLRLNLLSDTLSRRQHGHTLSQLQFSTPNQAAFYLKTARCHQSQRSKEILMLRCGPPSKS